MCVCMDANWDEASEVELQPPFASLKVKLSLLLFRVPLHNILQCKIEVQDQTVLDSNVSVSRTRDNFRFEFAKQTVPSAGRGEKETVSMPRNRKLP